MRLTEKGARMLDLDFVEELKNYKEPKIYNKLADLEDIEEELGIEIATLWKAITQGVYALYAVDKEPAFIEPNKVYILKDRLSVGFYPEDWTNDKLMHDKECRWGCLYNKYGKTWALTKEELEK